MKIFVSGSIAYDRIMDFPGYFRDHILPDKIHILNVCFLVNGLDEKFGGTAGNIAYSLALLEEKPIVLSSFGRDFAEYEKRFNELGLSLEGINYIKDEFTAGAYITTDKDDNQITGFNPGAMKYRAKSDFSGVDPKNALAIVAPGNLDDMLELPEKYRQMGLPFICDPGQNITAFPGEKLLAMLTGAYILISNDYELEMIMKNTGKSLAELLGVCGHVITTLGDKGSIVRSASREWHVAPCKAENAVDPTGAGDAYRAGLIKGLTSGKQVDIAARYGSTCAAYAVERYGTQEHRFTLDEFMLRHRATFGTDE